MDVISSFIAFSDFNSMFLSRTEERDTRNVLKDMRRTVETGAKIERTPSLAQDV